MTIFLLKIGICGLTEQNISCLDCPGSLDSGCTPPHLLHIIRSAGLQLLAPLLPCFPGLIEGKLEEAQSPYTSFFLLMKVSLALPVGGEVAGPLLPWY